MSFLWTVSPIKSVASEKYKVPAEKQESVYVISEVWRFAVR